MKKGLFFSLSFIGKIGIETALPLVVFAFLGSYFDHRFNTTPKLFIVAIVFAAFISFFILRKTVKDAIEKIKELD
ncbi:MAG: AtpZ/AtpI family protein [Candidatus Berkelbacteria bacterium]|nr:AtpZ/AtpI family protein [Candidatus Berkelbacteria bacterium]